MNRDQSDLVSVIFSPNEFFVSLVIGKVIKDNSQQQFDEHFQFPIHIERLDTLLETKSIDIRLAKMDAQGFECNVLDGMGKALAEKIDVVVFEYADKWLFGQGCVDLLPRMNKFGFNIYKKYANGHFFDPLEAGELPGENVVVDLFAVARGFYSPIQIYKEAVSRYHPRLYNRSHGWRGQTYKETVDFCHNSGENDLCPFKIICPFGTNSEPILSYAREDSSWVPIIDKANEWVQISHFNSCIKYSSMNPEPPEWGYNGIGNEEITRNILCCAAGNAYVPSN